MEVLLSRMQFVIHMQEICSKPAGHKVAYLCQGRPSLDNISLVLIIYGPKEKETSRKHNAFYATFKDLLKLFYTVESFSQLHI